MKRILFHPYFSMQDKRTGKFLLHADSGVKLYTYLCGRCREAGYDAVIALPRQSQCMDSTDVPHAVQIPYMLSTSNFDRRLQWDPAWLRRIATEYDAVFTQHEFMAYPLRCLAGSNLRIAMECGILPTTAYPQTSALFSLAWNSADLVHCNSRTLQQYVSVRTATPCTVWSFAYDSRDVHASAAPRDIDVLFNSRCSATLYSHHDVLLEAISSDMRALFTDPTSYLRKDGHAYVPEHALDRPAYLGVLRHSRVVVGLTDNGYGGYAFVEAIAHGACPVALRCREYEELLTPAWPYYAETLDAASVRTAVLAALAGGLEAVPCDVHTAMQAEMQKRSYEGAWEMASRDIRRLLA